MASIVSQRVSSYKERVSEHLRIPLFRNGYALAASSAVTSSIGVIYWILATHFYPAEVVGLNSAIISLMMFLGGLAQLNLLTAHIRFIPNAGSATRRFIGITYLVALVLAGLISIAYVTNIHIFSPALSILRSSAPITISFVLATMGWSIFVLQDSALTGLRQATWVPIENGLFAVGKIGLMILLSFFIPQLGLFYSWFLGLAITLLPTNALIFFRFGPRHEKASTDRATELIPGQVIQYAGGDLFGAIFWLGATTLLPIMVTQAAGAKENAYFYLAWQIAYMLHLLSSNMGSSLIVEASTNQSKLGEYSRRIILQLVLLVGFAVLVIFAGAPLILRIFGQDYAAQGSSLLRLLALAAIPNIVTSVFVSISRVQRRMRRVIFSLGALCVLVLSLSAFLLPRFGILGAGIAWLGAETVVAIGILILGRGKFAGSE
jgi:O-antigen/teichoic acid export membrane protein